jgi:hypothetical protein
MSGIVLGVFAMLYGTERHTKAPAVVPHERVSEHDPRAEPSPLFNSATIASMLFAAGLSGYLFDRYSSLSNTFVGTLAIAIGLVVLALQSLLFSRWAIPGARADKVDERYLLQGTLGIVTRDIVDDSAGAVRYALEGREYLLPARNLETGAMSAGTEVVIERIEDGVAYVELWERVEQRL